MLQNRLRLGILQLQRLRRRQQAQRLQILWLLLDHPIDRLLRLQRQPRQKQTPRFKQIRRRRIRIDIPNRVDASIDRFEIEACDTYFPQQLDRLGIIRIGIPSRAQLRHRLRPIIVQHQIFRRRHPRRPIAPVDHIVRFDKHLHDRVMEIRILLIHIVQQCPPRKCPPDRRNVRRIRKRRLLPIAPVLQKIMWIGDKPPIRLPCRIHFPLCLAHFPQFKMRLDGIRMPRQVSRQRIVRIGVFPDLRLHSRPIDLPHRRIQAPPAPRHISPTPPAARPRHSAPAPHRHPLSPPDSRAPACTAHEKSAPWLYQTARRNSDIPASANPQA